MSLLDDFQREQGLLVNRSSGSGGGGSGHAPAAAGRAGAGAGAGRRGPGAGGVAGGLGGSLAPYDSFDTDPMLSNFVKVGNLEEEKNIFTFEAVKYPFQGSLIDLVVSSNIIALALDTNHVQRIDLQNPSEVDDVEISSKIQDKIHRIFLDPTAKHMLISMVSGDNYYLHAKSKKCRNLKSLKGHVIESVAWNKTEPHDPTTKEFLVGTTKGAIIELEIDPVDEFMKKDVRNIKQVFQIQENTTPAAGGKSESLAITGLRFELFLASTKKYFILASTATRLYQFVGYVGGGQSNSYFESVFANYKQNTGYSEFPNENSPPGKIDFFSQHRGSIKSFAWLTCAGIYYGNFAFGSQNPGDNVIDQAKLLPYPQLAGSTSSVRQKGDDQQGPAPLNILVTEFHFLLLYPDRLLAINRLNEKVVYEELFPARYVPFKRLEVDRINDTFWSFSANGIFEIIITKEARDAWKIYLDLGDFHAALQYCENAAQKDRVYTAQAEHYFAKKNYKNAARFYAQTNKSFEEITLLFIRNNERDALKEYLLRKIDYLKHNDWTQLTIICTWLVEIYLNQLNYLKDANDEKGYLEMQEEFHQFLSTQNVKDRLNKNANVTYNLISNHGLEEEMVYFATLMEDYDRVISHYIQLGDYKQALSTLSKQSHPEIYYKFSPLLMEKAPYETVSCWIREPKLDPLLLIPALLKYDPHANPEGIHQNQAIRFLQHCVDKYNIEDPTIHNFLLSLYIQQEDDAALMNFIGSESKQHHFDLQYALRLCTQHGKTQARILISSALGLYEEAVELALQANDLELAKINADKPEDDDATRKSLWLRIARHVVSEDNKGETSIKRAMAFLKECDLLKIEDILPFFPDFVLIDDFKDEICAALEEYNRHIQDLKVEMDDATQSAEAIRLDIQDLRYKYGFVEANAKCYLCRYPLFTRQFYLFSCQHVFHQNCLTEEVMKHLSTSNRTKITKYLDIIAKESANLQNAPKKPEDTTATLTPLQQAKIALDDLIASECILCGDIMIKSIEKSFISENELDTIRSWQL